MNIYIVRMRDVSLAFSRSDKARGYAEHELGIEVEWTKIKETKWIADNTKEMIIVERVEVADPKSLIASQS